MRKMSLKSTLLAGSAVLVISGSAAPAFAIAAINSSAGQAAASTRLDAAKLRLCTVREKVIGNILTRISDRGNRHITLISDVATKTEAFYTKSGKTLSNYDSLVATVNADKTAAQTAVDQLKTDSTSFSCSGSDPVGTLNIFKNDLKGELTALQDYKTAVKNLIVGVKSVQSDANGGSQ